ncbi:MAG: DUF885 domain-containing protein [Fimbriimonadaceae bacterium]|nr:DUF885 domain-containing protein [Fimbriimonadaceae bacterium]
MTALVLVATVVSGLARPSTTMFDTPQLPNLIREYVADKEALERLHNIEGSKTRNDRLVKLEQDWERRLDALDAKKLDFDDSIDAFLFRNHLRKQVRKLELEAKKWQEIEPLLPFATTIIEFQEARRRFERVDPEAAAAKLTVLKKHADELRKKVESEELKSTKPIANRAAKKTLDLATDLGRWAKFHRGYDPLFTWWVDKPLEEADKALKAYAKALLEKIVGIKEDDRQAIVGLPVGREALLADLAFEMIPYSPEELIAMGDKEFAWCEAEMKKASRELGFGDDWKKALEHVKDLHVEPGKQPELVRELALEAVEFLKAKDLVTIPPLAEETWRMEMMPAEAQKTNPFFLGGETIIVSFPTNEMTHDEKRMSLRGNNRHFARATVQHELIPGHHLQFFMTSRYRPYREPFETPFWTEGWALYWEMLLWDQGFAKSPEDRIGMLFWRMHRCARIVFSLKFHLGEMSPEECIKFLVEKVGHEPANAEGEVRRSFSGDYPPLYQIAYMIGGLQFRALHRELVESGKMTNRAFHDAILREANIPVAALRAILRKELPDGKPWKFGS